MSGLGRLAARVEAIPEAVSALLARGLPPLRTPLAGRRIDVTGAGVSEAPARDLVARLGGRFLPLSVLAVDGAGGDLLVVFSQGLSPNARIALARAERYRSTILFTSVTPPALPPSVEVIELPPREPEDGMLLRVLGPAIARAAAQLFADEVERAEGRPPPPPLDPRAALEGALAWGRARPVQGPIAFVAHGEELALARTLAWKWMEGLWTPEPPSWDVLAFAHGPLQSVYDRPLTLVSLEREAHPSHELFSRLGELLIPSRHRLLRAVATLPGPLEHDAALDGMILASLEAMPPRALDAWPGRDRDAALYAIDRPFNA